MQKKTLSQSLNKITLNHPLYREKNYSNNQNAPIQAKIPPVYSQAYVNENQKPNFLSKNTFIEFINGQYFGKVNNQKEPEGMGILIDDEMNFFLSEWRGFGKMHGLSFVKLSRDISIYGSWIKGEMNGFNVIAVGQFEVFLQSKGPKIASPVLVVNKSASVAYLLNTLCCQRDLQTKDESRHKFQIIDRKKFSQLKQSGPQGKYQQVELYDPNQIFESLNLKIPFHLHSLKNFVNHLAHNKEELLLNSFELKYQESIFISIQQTMEDNKKHYFQPFNSQQRQMLKNIDLKPNKVKQKRLGIILEPHSFRTKSMGSYDHCLRLNGMGINFSTESVQLGIFKEDMLTRQFNQDQFFTNQFIDRDVKRIMRHQHLKSLNFKNQFFYLQQVKQVSVLANKVQKYVEIFQLQYLKKYPNSQDSISVSEKSFQHKYLPKINISDIKNKVENRAGKQKIKLNSVRPFGFIVNSRSPLRNIENKSRSQDKYPSELDTLRKTNGSHVNQQSSFSHHQGAGHLRRDKSLEHLKIRTQSYAVTQSCQPKYSRKTSKHKQYIQRRNENPDKYMNFKRTEIEQQQLQDTVRQNNVIRQNYHRSPNEKNSLRLVTRLKSPKRQLFWK